MVVGKSSLIFVWVVALALAQDKPLPKFEDFKVAEVFKDTPAVPILTTPRQHQYRTMIRLGAKSRYDFAGHFKIAGWGCGSSCEGFAIVDSKNGQVFDTPFEYYEWNDLILNKDYANDYGPTMENISFRDNSRLLVIRGCPDEKNCGTYYYEWTGSELKLLRKIPAIKR
jgi:hypothetical protein